MNGKVLPDTPIAVDCWQLRKCLHVRLFFLSHMHSDHTCGLSSTWSHRPIYCSPLTAKLLRLKLQIKQKWIRPLEIGQDHMLMLDDLGKERLTVNLIDANHCPGAVMFLFQGYFGTRLYTGDFRYTPSMLRVPCLQNHINIDVLYLDNTNCDPTRALPSRQQATQQIKQIIRDHPGYAVVIGLYSLGKESLLVDLAMEFKTWVEVDRERLETLRVLQLPNVYVVPYSDHSSYQELEDFVSALSPISLVPIVGNCLPYFSSLLSPRKKPKAVVIPESVKQYMMTNSNIRSSTNGMIQRTSRPEVRGVVFDSPETKLSQPNHDDMDSNDTEIDHDTTDRNSDSDCILLDLGTNSYHRDNDQGNKRLKLIRIESEDVVTVTSSLTMDDNESVSTRKGIGSPDPSLIYECDHESPTKSSKEKSPEMGSTNSGEMCSSMDSMHDQTSLTTAAALTLPNPQSVTSAIPITLESEQFEHWLLENFTIPAEELKGGQVSRGLCENYRLNPVDLPKPVGDPLEAAIKRLMSN